MSGRERTPGDGEDRVARRALVAGGLVWVLVGGALGVAQADEGGQASAAGALMGLAAGSFTATVWLLLAWVLDLVARQPTPPSRRRWTYGALALTLVSPLLALSAATLPPP